MAEKPVSPPSAATGATYQPQWGIWTRQFMTVLLVIAGVYALTLLRPVIQMLVIAFLIAAVMFTPARFLARRTPLSYPLAVILLYLLLILVLIFMLSVFTPAFINGANGLVRSAEVAFTDLQQMLAGYTPDQGIVDILGIRLDFNFILGPLRNFIIGAPGDTTGGTGGALESVNLQDVLNGIFNVAGTITGTVASAITGVTGLVTTIVLSVFISFLVLLDLPNFERIILRGIPPDYHREYALLAHKIRRVWNGFFRGQVIIGIIIGLLTYLQLRIMGVPGAGVLAIITGVISLIPTIGGIIALIPLSIVPLLQGSTVFTEMPNGWFALLVVGVNLLMSQVIWNVVAPKILGDALDLPLPAIIVGVFIGAAVGGVLGAFLIAPILGTLQVTVIYVFRKITLQDPFPGQEAPEHVMAALRASR